MHRKVALHTSHKFVRSSRDHIGKTSTQRLPAAQDQSCVMHSDKVTYRKNLRNSIHSLALFKAWRPQTSSEHGVDDRFSAQRIEVSEVQGDQHRNGVTDQARALKQNTVRCSFRKNVLCYVGDAVLQRVTLKTFLIKGDHKFGRKDNASVSHVQTSST